MRGAIVNLARDTSGAAGTAYIYIYAVALVHATHSRVDSWDSWRFFSIFSRSWSSRSWRAHISCQEQTSQR
jgi:hypothetical protein